MIRARIFRGEKIFKMEDFRAIEKGMVTRLRDNFEIRCKVAQKVKLSHFQNFQRPFSVQLLMKRNKELFNKFMKKKGSGFIYCKN